MLTNLRKRNQGFTIVETLIVLAIAGLIILIVLLAVPALQRSSRNTNIKNNASAIASGISEYESNNAGGLPTAAGSSQNGATVTFCGGTSATCAATYVASTSKIQASDVVKFESTATPTSGNYAKAGYIDVDFGYVCTNATGAAVTASARSVAILYSIESGSNSLATQCESS